MVKIGNFNVDNLACLGAGGTALMAAGGYFGGQIVQVLIPSASPWAHASVLGLWAPAGLGMYAVAERINRNGGVANMAIGLIGGYFASWAFTNLIGLSINLFAPFGGLTALAVVASVVAAVAAPVVIMCVGTAGFSMAALRSKF